LIRRVLLIKNKETVLPNFDTYPQESEIKKLQSFYNEQAHFILKRKLFFIVFMKRLLLVFPKKIFQKQSLKLKGVGKTVND